MSNLLPGYGTIASSSPLKSCRGAVFNNHLLGHANTELAIHALDQVHCWGAYFRPRIGHYEKFTLLNF
jgi:hypothetical protein